LAIKIPALSPFKIFHFVDEMRKKLTSADETDVGFRDEI